MIKVRLTYNQEDTQELQKVLEIINSNFNILNQSKEYEGRGKSKYSNIYIDISLVTENDSKER